MIVKSSKETFKLRTSNLLRQETPGPQARQAWAQLLDCQWVSWSVSV